ncbi:hypothetical protein BC628DRAFT_1413298 [Trametes gibbosa]|nr:hypothetical protein BC628DRAFT_1413298 [Trametes gibbosa]
MSALDTPAESVHTPFSPSFDPNVSTPFAQTPLALRPGGSPMPGARMGAGAGAGGTAVGDVSSRGGVCAGPTDPLWSQRLSASFSTIADQIAAASRALAIAEAPSGSSVEVAALAERLDAVERAQDVMGAQLRAVQELLANVKVNVGGPHLPRGAEEVEEVRKDGEGGDFKSGVEIAVEELQRQVGGVVETIRLDQARLHARLHNAAVSANKMQIKAPVMANGKTPSNFPNTKGEFEHLTKERYEALLKGYNLPVTGDTNAKREALREFIGLTPAV